MADTRARLAAAGLAHAELPAVADIDEPADLALLPPGWLDGLVAADTPATGAPPAAPCGHHPNPAVPHDKA
jgi:hypothetical protein